MQSIGQMIEGIMLPQLKLLLTLSRIKRSKSISFETIEGLKLGNIIQELIDTENEYITRRLIDTITNNKLSVIRNICYHHNYEFNGGKYYLDKVDKAGKTRYEVSNEELQHLWNFVSLTNSFFRVAEISFIQDNLQFIQDNLPDDHYDNLQVREDINDFRFYTSMLGQGFQIVDAKETEELLKVTVKETRIDARYFERMIHSSQFLFHLHQESDSVKYEIDYLTRDGILYSKVSAYRNEIDNLVNSGHKNSKLMHPHVVNFEFENKKFRQDVDVFKNLNQLKLNRFANHTFFDQRGEEISGEEFISKFCKTVFCNYLLLVNFFPNDQISISIGKDGGTVYCSERSEGNAILISKAPLINEELQRTIRTILKETIRLYHKHLLLPQIITDAMNENLYAEKFGALLERKRNAANNMQNDNAS
jgi:hypothetical protein